MEFRLRQPLLFILVVSIIELILASSLPASPPIQSPPTPAPHMNLACKAVEEEVPGKYLELSHEIDSPIPYDDAHPSWIDLKANGTCIVHETWLNRKIAKCSWGLQGSGGWCPKVYLEWQTSQTSSMAKFGIPSNHSWLMDITELDPSDDTVMLDGPGTLLKASSPGGQVLLKRRGWTAKIH